MDYIRQELLRQQTALTALLLGGPPGQAEASAAAARQKTALQTLWTAETSAFDISAPVGPAPDKMGDSAGLKSTYAEQGQDGAVWSAVRGVNRTIPWGEYAAPAIREAAWEKTQDEPTEARIRMVTEILGPDIETAAGPKDLSRAFERDARRYDGGFSLY